MRPFLQSRRNSGATRNVVRRSGVQWIVTGITQYVTPGWNVP